MHTSKRMHFIEDGLGYFVTVATSTLHTSKRMHFIEDTVWTLLTGIPRLLHTSKRMHFIEEPRTRSALSAPGLAYVKTYALH